MKWKKVAALSTSISVGLAFLGILLWLLASPTAAHADPNNLFVTTGGVGTACSQTVPCTLPTAMGQAVDGDAIYLAAGEYTGSGISVITVTESITIFGSWDGTATAPPVRDPAAHPTTLDGEGRRQVVYISSWITPTLDGLIITGGDATTAWDPGRGGGIYSIDSNPILRNNIIRENIATTNGRGFGGGVYVNYGSNARLVNNVVLSNTASITGGTGDGGGIALVWHPGAILTGNQVAHNVAQGGTASSYGSDGGGIFCSLSHNMTVHDNVIQSNVASVLANGSGGGIGLHICDRVNVFGNTLQGNVGSTSMTGGTGRGGSLSAYGSQDLILDANWVLSNTAQYGGGIYLSRLTTFTMTNNIIAANQARFQGGGIAFETSEVEPVTGIIAHNTLVGNDRGPADGGVAIHLNNSYVSLVLTNNLIFSHTYGIFAVQNSSATLYNTLFYANSMGDTGGSGDITNLNSITDRAPLLNTAYHLLPFSPAVDSGVALPWLTNDIDGDTRPFHLGYDIGADEYSGILPEHFYYLPFIRQ